MPLNKLRKKRTTCLWTETCNDSVIKLKRIVTNPPVLTIPNFQKPFYLYTDVSEAATGSEMMQQ